MGQNWTILNADKEVSLEAGGKFPSFFLRGFEAAFIVELISAATVKFPKDPLEDQPYNEARKFKSDRTGICDLPCELQDAIFAEIRNPVDVFAFCLTASHFWRIGLSHYKALYMDHVRRIRDWSGDQLICIGDAAVDYPQGLFTDEELDVLRTSYFEVYGHESPDDLELIWAFHELRNVQWANGHRITDRCKLKRLNPLYRSPKRKQKRRLNAGVMVSATADLSEEDEPGNDLPMVIPLYKYNFLDWMQLPAASGTIDYAKPTILRNLSQKVYVRDDFLPLDEEDANADDGDDTKNEDAEPYYMSYGHLLLLRIAWTTDLSLGTTNEHELCRGIWAGDRFDIVNIDAIEHEEGWTDVSAEGREQLIGIWKEMYGDEWQAELREMEW